MIGTHRQTMRVYKTRQQSLKYSDFQSRGERRSATIDDIENTLLEIESEMVMESATRRDSRSSLNSASTGSHSSDRDVYRDDERNPRDAGIADPRHHRRRRRPLQESSNEFLLRTTNEPNSIQFRDVLQHHQTLPTPESSSFSVDESMMQIRGEPEPGGALHLDEGDYIAVRPSDRVLHLSPSLDYQIVEGYVNSKTSPTSANTCYDITENIISELYAAQLGLQIFYCETDDDNHADIGTMERDIEREIDFGNGDVRPVIGSTCFDWKDSPQANGLRPLKVTCLVSRYVPLQTQLVFGQPFLRRREHYWRR